MGQIFSTSRPQWWDAYANRGINAGELRDIIERARCHFGNYNLARLIVEQLLKEGMTFYGVSSDGAFFQVSNDMVIRTLRRAIETHYATAVQEFYQRFTRVHDTLRPSVLAGPLNRHASLTSYLDYMDLANAQEVAGPTRINPPSHLNLPPGAVIMDLRYTDAATTKILCHVIDAVRSTYSIPSLARHISQRMASEDAGAHSLFFIEQALEMGYLVALQQARNPNVGGGATADDDSSIGTLSIDKTDPIPPDDLECAFD